MYLQLGDARAFAHDLWKSWCFLSGVREKVARIAAGTAARRKNLRMCRADAFENPQFRRVARRPVFGSH
jgi:hypothetical protein